MLMQVKVSFEHGFGSSVTLRINSVEKLQQLGDKLEALYLTRADQRIADLKGKLAAQGVDVSKILQNPPRNRGKS